MLVIGGGWGEFLNGQLVGLGVKIMVFVDYMVVVFYVEYEVNLGLIESQVIRKCLLGVLFVLVFLFLFYIYILIIYGEIFLLF